ncbi:MAG: phosphate transporter permease subunit PstC [Chloroflexota bacterium]
MALSTRLRVRSRITADGFFRWALAAAVAAAALLLVAVIYTIANFSTPLWGAVKPLDFLFGSGWNGVSVDEAGVTKVQYGAWPMIWGTLVTSLIGILVAAPVGILAAVYLVEFAPRRLAAPLTFLVEIVAAIPSVVIGLWALGDLSPRLRDSVEWWIASTLGHVIPWLSENPEAPSSTTVFRAGIVLAIMITPMVVAVGREVIRSVPQSLREGYIGMGATEWETIRAVVLPTARIGLIGAVLLAFGRAIGETIAVRLVIGMADSAVPSSLFQSGSSVAAKIAGNIGEADLAVERGALAGLGLALFAVTFVLSLCVRVLIRRANGGAGRGR